MNKKKNKLTYADAGVDIDAMEDSLGRIKKDVMSTFNSMVIKNVGGFGTLHEIPAEDEREQVLISSIDGVGTKMMVARKMQKYDTVGQDLINHCVNDILTLGARPLYFLDYVGTESLEPEVMEQIVSGLATGCRENNLALLGGETAEMPGVYVKGESDLVGCITGIANRGSLITGRDIKKGDSIIGLGSSGLHTNG